MPKIKDNIIRVFNRIFRRNIFPMLANVSKQNYNNTPVDYKGIQLKTQSKEYTYMSKSRETRAKDKLDDSIIEPTLDEKSMEKIMMILN